MTFATTCLHNGIIHKFLSLRMSFRFVLVIHVHIFYACLAVLLIVHFLFVKVFIEKKSITSAILFIGNACLKHVSYKLLFSGSVICFTRVTE